MTDKPTIIRASEEADLLRGKYHPEVKAAMDRLIATAGDMMATEGRSVEIDKALEMAHAHVTIVVARIVEEARTANL